MFQTIVDKWDTLGKTLFHDRAVHSPEPPTPQRAPDKPPDTGAGVGVILINLQSIKPPSDFKLAQQATVTWQETRNIASAIFAAVDKYAKETTEIMGAPQPLVVRRWDNWHITSITEPQAFIIKSEPADQYSVLVARGGSLWNPDGDPGPVQLSKIPPYKQNVYFGALSVAAWLDGAWIDGKSDYVSDYLRLHDNASEKMKGDAEEERRDLADDEAKAQEDEVVKDNQSRLTQNAADDERRSKRILDPTAYRPWGPDAEPAVVHRGRGTYSPPPLEQTRGGLTDDTVDSHDGLLAQAYNKYHNKEAWMTIMAPFIANLR